MTSAYLTLERRDESQARSDIRAHRLSTLKLLEAALKKREAEYDYAHDCCPHNSAMLDELRIHINDLRTRINRLKYTLGLDAITTGNADWEAEQEEKKEQGFRMWQGGQ